jgi:hypothetical protein
MNFSKSILRFLFCEIREHIDEDIKLFGKNDKWFDYSKAPRRGRLENTRDFSHKKLYLKYHENPDNPQNNETSTITKK